MFELAVEDTFDAAHRLPGYIGKCERVHGHTWKVRMVVYCNNDTQGPEGICIDFALLKGMLKEELDRIDHTYLNNTLEYPTAENIAKMLYDEIKVKLDQEVGRLIEVYVYETPECGVLYREGN